jgi:hypothetical protein
MKTQPTLIQTIKEWAIAIFAKFKTTLAFVGLGFIFTVATAIAIATIVLLTSKC